VLSSIDSKIDRAIDLLQVAIIELDMLQNMRQPDEERVSEAAERITKYVLDSADQIRQVAPAFPKDDSYATI
jgi:hypothetical protein